MNGVVGATALGVAAVALAALGPWWVRDGEARGRAARLARAGSETAPGREGADVEVAVVLALVEAACRAGAGVVRALDAVGGAVGGAAGRELRGAAAALALGAGWEEAWGRARDPTARRADGADDVGGAGAAGALRDALRPTWEHGSPPVAALRTAAEQRRRDRAERATVAAGRLGVRLVLPLGLCYLPAFVLVGLVPVLVSYGVGLLGGSA